MRLRSRVSLAFFSATTAIIGAISFATYSLFAAAEVRELDRELIARVQHEAENISHSQGLMNVVQGGQLRIGALDDHVKFAALFDDRGRLVARSETFGDGQPPQEALVRASHAPFDFAFGERPLRGVLWPVPDGQLLLAASRGGLNEDLRALARLLFGLFIGGILLSLLFAGALSRRLTQDIEHLANVSRRISAGELQARVVRGSVGSAAEVRSLAEDLNAMVDSLQSALAVEQRFVSNAAHELRSPLTVLSGEIELALRRERSNEDYKRALTDALENTRALQQLAENLLDLARTRLTHAARTSTADLQDAVAAAVRMVAARGARIDVDVPSARVRGHASDLSRLFRNLIENAVEHAPSGSVVRVKGHEIDSAVRVSVEDDGAGVDAGLQQRLFEPFVRGGEERARSGAGLGLAIAQEIAHLCGGELRLESPRAPTRFVVVLPCGA